MADESLREIVAFYTDTSEELRLRSGSSQLEFERTKELLRRFLPIPPARVIDVGGASWPYALCPPRLGDAVHLIDVAPRLVDVALEQNAEAPHRLASVAVGDARRLSFEERSV